MKYKARELYMYPGRLDNHDYKALPLSNMLLFGNTGSEKSTFLNSVIIRLIMECNPKEIDINFIVKSKLDLWPWDKGIEGQRIIPQFSSYFCLEGIGEENFVDTFVDYTEQVLLEIKDKRAELDRIGAVDYLDYCEKSWDAWKQSVNIVTEFSVYWDLASDEQKQWLTDSWEYIIDKSEDVGMYFFMSAQSHVGNLSDDCITYFPIKVCTKVDEEVSLKMLEEDWATTKLNNYGDVWCKYLSGTPMHLYVPFYPDTWISKFVRYYGVQNT